MIYVASCYSDPSPFVRQARYEMVCTWIGRRTREQVSPLFLYSPIVYWHPLALAFDFPTDVAFWWSINKAALDSAKALYLLKFPGWKKSVGVRQELEYAKEIGLEITRWKL